MTTTNFPSGLTSYGVPLIGSGAIPITAGNYWFVNSATGNSGGPGAFDAPYATLAQAIAVAAANDVIVIQAGHAETIIAAGGVTVNKAGLQIVGLGTGDARPQFTFGTATTASFLITSASVSVTNIIGLAGIDQLTQPFDVRASGVTLGIEWRDTATNVEALRAVLGTAAADKLNINLTYLGQTGGSHCVNAIRLVGTDVGILNVNLYGKASTAWVEFVTTACSDIEIYGYMYNSGTTNGSKNVVDTVGGSTWFASIFDGSAGQASSGGSGASLSGGAAASTKVATKAAATITNGQVLFTVAGGPIVIESLVSICATANDTTASTLQYSATPTTGSAQTISNASASLASAAAGASVTLAGTALATAALLNANGPNLIANPGTILVPIGTITAVVGVGSTTGTWTHYLRYRPLTAGSIAS